MFVFEDRWFPQMLRCFQPQSQEGWLSRPCSAVAYFWPLLYISPFPRHFITLLGFSKAQILAVWVLTDKIHKYTSFSCALGHPHLEGSPSILTTFTKVHKSKSRKSTFTLFLSTHEKTILQDHFWGCSITCHKKIVSVHAGAFNAAAAD